MFRITLFFLIWFFTQHGFLNNSLGSFTNPMLKHTTSNHPCVVCQLAIYYIVDFDYSFQSAMGCVSTSQCKEDSSAGAAAGRVKEFEAWCWCAWPWELFFHIHLHHFASLIVSLTSNILILGTSKWNVEWGLVDPVLYLLPYFRPSLRGLWRQTDSLFSPFLRRGVERMVEHLM